MAADHALLTRSLSGFYDFAGKVVLLVGAGHGQLLDPTISAKKLIAVDHDLAALREFQTKFSALPAKTPIEVFHGKFEKVTDPADVVYFEFCLHEIADPFAALKRARTLAPDVVVFDHSPSSKWIFYAAEEALVRRSASAMQNFGIRRSAFIRTTQTFRTGAELLSKVSAQGPVAVSRAERFVNSTDFAIPMMCELALL